jgi:hypothetical protein
MDSRPKTLTDFLPANALCPGRPSFAELCAHLSNCLGLPVQDLETVLAATDPDSLSLYLAGDHAGAVRLRDALQLDPEKVDPALIAAALSLPEGQILAALFGALERMTTIRLEPEMVLAARLKHVKRSILAGWKRALHFAAPQGYIAEADAYEIGIGSMVYQAMLAQCGKTDIEALSSAEFLQLAPRLIEFWPVSEEGLACLSSVLFETEAYIEGHLDAEFMAMSDASAMASSG